MSKDSHWSCRCTSHPRGNPKYSNGSCYLSGDVRPSVRQRIDGKKYCRNWEQEYEEEEPI